MYIFTYFLVALALSTVGSATLPPRGPSFDARFSDVNMLICTFTPSLDFLPHYTTVVLFFLYDDRQLSVTLLGPVQETNPNHSVKGGKWQ